MKKLYSWASAILSRFVGKPFKGLVLVLNQGLKDLKNVLLMRFEPMTKVSIENDSSTKPTWLVC